METRTISTRLVLDGESEYKAALKNINAELALHKSELAKVEAEYRNNANSVQALEAKQRVLSSQSDALAQKHQEQAAMLEKARQAQQKYAEQVAQAKARLDELKTATGATTEQEEKLKKELAEASENLKKATSSATNYQRQLNYTERDQANVNAELSNMDKYLDEARAAADGCATSIDQYGKEVKQAGRDSDEFGDKSKGAVDALASALAAAGVAASIKEIAQAIKACTDAYIEFESAITGVYKTVEGTPEQLAAISDGIKQLSTEIPATTTEIAAVAEAAGQLGIATDDVLAFSRVMLDLGESTNLSAEEAASALAKFANITGTAAGDYERLGSVIVGLGNNFATTEADIVAMSTRLAGAGTLAGLTESEIMALATAMSSVGIEAEAGGTAMTQTLTAIEKAVAKGGDDLSEFARIAGMSSAQFATAWETNAISAIQAFISGLGRLDEQGESAVLVLDELGLSGVRQSNMLKSLGLAADTLTSAVSLSSQAWDENIALAEEAGKRYGTTESKLAMCANAANNAKIAIGDALAPALRDLAELGTDAFTWAAEFIEENQWLVQALTGVTVAIGALAAGVAGYTVVTKVAAAATAVFATATASVALPVIAVAAAMTGLVAALRTMSSASDSASKKTRELCESAKELRRANEEARAAYEETAQGADAQREKAIGLMTALEELAAVEEKTAAEKSLISGLVDQLNEAVPELSLAYDEESDSLTGLTGSIEEYIEAEARRQLQEAAGAEMVRLKMQEIDLDSRLKEARAALEEATKLSNESATEGVAAMSRYGGAVSDATYAVSNAEWAIKDLEDQIAETEAQLKGTKEQYDSYTESIVGATDASARQSEQVQNTTVTQEELSAANEELEKTTKTLTAAQDTLTGALKEQEEKGSLSLDTTLALIDAGYASAIAIDAETGAITLNKDAYIAIAQAKIEEQIQALETQRQSAITRTELLAEANAANDVATEYTGVAKAKLQAEWAAKGGIGVKSGEIAALDAQIASLRAARNAIGSYSGAVASSARASSSASKKVKTQAEQDLEAFKGIQAELKHALNMGEISNKEYYTALHDAQQQYLNDPANLEASRRIGEEIHKYNEGLETYQRLRSELDHELKVGAINEESYYKRLTKLRDDYLTDDSALDALAEREKVEEELYDREQDRLKEFGDQLKEAISDYQDQIDSVAEEYMDKLAEVQDAMDDLQKRQDAMTSKLGGYGDLFTIDNYGNLHLEDLEKQRQAVADYGKVLEDLKAKGINGELLNEILGMDIDNATAYGTKLLKMNDKDWDEYNQAYQDKQDEAFRIAKEFYQKQMGELEAEYNGILDEALGTLEQTAFDSGADTITELIKGMEEKADEAARAAAKIVGAVEAEFKSMWLEVGPIGVKMPEVDGSHAGGLSYVPYDGYLAELHKGERVLTADEAKAFISASMPRRYDVPQQGGGQMAQLQGMMQTVLQNQAARQESNPPIQIETVIEMDGEVVARKQFTYNRREERLHGKSFVDRG